MARILLCALIIAVVICNVYSLSGTCPPSSKMLSCSPKCKDDTECSGRKCCPNICNAKSCVPANLQSNNDEGYKNSKKGATGSYCGNVKCNSYEKCEQDRQSKREKCVRA